MYASSSLLAKTCGVLKSEMDSILVANEVPYEQKSFYDKVKEETISYRVYDVLTVVKIMYALEARGKSSKVTQEELDKVEEEHLPWCYQVPTKEEIDQWVLEHSNLT